MSDGDVMAEVRELVDQLYELVDELRTRLDELTAEGTGDDDGG